MISIQNALEQIIYESPFLEDGLYHQYINLTSFSMYIKPKIELLTKKEVTIGAIKMALSRYIKEKQSTIEYKRFSAHDFFIKKNMTIVYIEKNHETLHILKEVNSKGLLKDEDYFTIIQGGKNITLIYNESLKDFILEMLPEKYIEMKVEDLSLVGVFLDENRINEIGIVYTLTKKINFSNINIIEIITNYKEIHFIVKNEDLKKTIDAIIV